MKASLLTNFPSLSRKWAGLKWRGSSHSLSSYRTDINRGNTVVPWWRDKELKGVRVEIKVRIKD